MDEAIRGDEVGWGKGKSEGQALGNRYRGGGVRIGFIGAWAQGRGRHGKRICPAIAAGRRR